MALSPNGDILVFNDKRSFSYRPADDTWADAGEVAAATCTTKPIARSGTMQAQPDVAESNGVRVVAWEDNRGGVWCEVLEAATGHVLLPQMVLDSSTNAKDPRCVPVGDSLLVLWTRADRSTIQSARITLSRPTAAPVFAVAADDLNGAVPFWDVDVAINGPSGQFGLQLGIMVWATTTGYRLGYLAQSGIMASPLIGVPSVTSAATTVSGPMAVSWDPVLRVAGVVFIRPAAALGVAFFSGATFAPIRSSSSLATLPAGGSRVTAAFGAAGTDGRAKLYWALEITAARSDLTSIVSGAALQTASTLDATTTTLRGHGLVSRAWHDGPTVTTAAADGDVYVMAAHTVRFFPYVVALRLSDDSGINSPGNTIAARLIPGEASGSLMRPVGAGVLAWTQSLPHVIPLNMGPTDVYSRTHACPLPYRIQLSSQNGDQFSEQGVKLAVLTMFAEYVTASLGRGLYLASAAPQHYDGEQWREADFHCAPDLGFDTTGAPVAMSSLITIGGAGSIANGSYLYAYWYEAQDAQGELHRGAVSVKMLVTMTGGPKSFSLQIPTCRLTRFANARICVARSKQGAIGTDQTIDMYKVTSNDPTVVTGANRYIVNDFTVDTVTFVDALSDAVLGTREPLYTNGGILSNDPSPWAGGVILSNKGRLFWTDSTDQNKIRFSQQRDDDTALEGPVSLSIVKDQFGGDIVALGALDDTIIPFSATATFIFGGPGPLSDPSVDASANGFTPIELVTTDVGCISPRSVGQTPVGLTFKSKKGIMLLTRAREIQNIGNDVQRFDGQNVVRTTLITTSQRVVYQTDAGRTLMWDYNRNAWSTWTNHEGFDAVLLDDLYYYLRTNSTVFAETPGIYKDDYLPIPFLIETAWLHFANYLQGWQRTHWAYFVGQYLSPHQLVVRYRLDYNDDYGTNITSDVNANFDPTLYGTGLYGAGPYGGPGGGSMRYQRRIHINKRCQAISFQIRDLEADDNFGASFELSELLLVGAGVGPAFKVGAARSA